MLKRNHFISLAAIAVLMVCGFACAQETKEAPKSPAAPEQKSSPSTPDTRTVDPIPAVGSQPSTEAVSQDDILKASEAFGHFIGRNLKAPGINFDLESIVKGMRDGFAGKPAPLSDKDYEELMAKIQEQAYAKMASENLKAANEFLEKNTKAEKVIEVEPGKLQYQILAEGQGAVVEEHSSPQIKYTGKFLDGSTFGSSEETGGPITIPLDQTIPGFSKGIVGMKEGEKRKLFVHPDYGYGTSGHLPPNSLLIFDVEVVKASSPESSQTGLAEEDADDDYEDDADEEVDYQEEKSETP